ncbi:sulfur carrier protein ThiS [Nemorincola caseinilytica]
MIVYVNNRPCDLTDGCDIAAALHTLGIPAQNGTAIAVNSDVIPRPHWPTHTLRDNDKVMIIKATQGG